MRDKMTRHHRHEKVNGGNDSGENISIVTQERHRAWHYLFGTRHPRDIARYITNVWIDPKWKLIAVPRETEQEPDNT
jgi:hypothetical protein